MEFLAEYGYIGLFLVSFIAATIFPLSSEGVLSLMLIYDYPLIPLVVVATLGNFLGGMSSYFLGYLGKVEFLSKYFRLDKAKLDRFQQKFQSKSGVIAFFCWLPVVGDLIAVSLGLFRAQVLSVSIFMFAGKFLRYAVWAGLTFYGIEIFAAN